MKLLLTTILTDRKYTEYSLRSLYAVVAEAPLDVEIRTYGKYELDANIYEDIIRGQYNIVYLHCDDLNENHISTVAEMVKKAAPSTAVIVGGMQVSFGTRNYMKANPWVDYVIRGEGETVLYNFLRSLIYYEFDFENIGGLAYRNDEEIVVNTYDDPVEMDELPFVYDMADTVGSVVYYETSRGTIDRNGYTQFLPDAKVRSLSLNRVCTELRYFLVKEVERVVFFDPWFNYNIERAYRIFEYLINNDNGVTVFEFNISGDNLDEETVRLLSEARPGLFEFNVEVASTNPEVLAAIGRKENIYQLMYNVTKLLQSKTVKVNLSIIAGLPYETETLFARSFNKTYGLAEGSPIRIDGLRLGKGTALRRDKEKYGYVFTERPPYDVISTDHMPAADLINVRSLAKVVAAYIGDGGFTASIPRILNDKGMKPYDLFKDLTAFIYEKNLGSKLHRKDLLTRALYAWASALYDEDEESLKLEILRDAVYADLEKLVPEDVLKKFERAGWELEG